jgi:hypothetical protein
MAAITDLSDLINRQSGGNSGTPNNLFYHKVPRVAGVAATAPIAGRGCSLWTYDGMPAGGAVPTVAAIPDRNIGTTGFREVTRAQRIQLAAGDTGIRAINTVTLSTTTGTVGNFGITIAQPLAWIPVGAAGTAGWRDYTTGLPGIPVINPDACLALMFIPAAATAPEVWGSLATIEK